MLSRVVVLVFCMSSNVGKYLVSEDILKEFEATKRRRLCDGQTGKAMSLYPKGDINMACSLYFVTYNI